MVCIGANDLHAWTYSSCWGFSSGNTLKAPANDTKVMSHWDNYYLNVRWSSNCGVLWLLCRHTAFGNLCASVWRCLLLYLSVCPLLCLFMHSSFFSFPVATVPSFAHSGLFIPPCQTLYIYVIRIQSFCLLSSSQTCMYIQRFKGSHNGY